MNSILKIDLSRDKNRNEESEFPKLVSFEIKGIKYFFSGIPWAIVRLT